MEVQLKPQVLSSECQQITRQVLISLVNAYLETGLSEPLEAAVQLLTIVEVVPEEELLISVDTDQLELTGLE
jgi:hypothetical protein